MVGQGTRVFLLLGLCATSFLACFSAGDNDDDCTLGTERCPCNMGACDSGLQCLSDTCVAPGSPGSSGSGATGSGSTGSGGTSTSGGGGGASSGSGGSDGSGATGGSGASGGSSSDGGSNSSGGTGGSDSSGGSAGTSGSGGGGGTGQVEGNLITNGTFSNGVTDWNLLPTGPTYDTDGGVLCVQLMAYGYITVGWPDDPLKAFALSETSTYTFSYSASGTGTLSMETKVGGAETNETLYTTNVELGASMQPYSHELSGIEHAAAGIVFIVQSTDSEPTEVCFDNVAVVEN